ncbi:hypothetical protein ABT001_30535 [Streptomyces sp. NPDC002793]|uniref:hypothetical protein n=1 Tax=Streptomyces sp. NPDC002793 TaxID=3154432 RepID=UPI00331B3C4C
MTDTPEHERTSDGDRRPPQWLEDAAHERLVAETYTRLQAAEDAAAAVDRIRAEMARTHPSLPADRPHPLRRLVLRLETSLAVVLLLPVILADHAHYAVTRRFTHRFEPVTRRADDYLYRLQTRITESGDIRFMDAVARWMDRAVDGLDALLARFGYPR